ncbi:MAG: hypothetical protein C4520_20175 [Candidatus Abyssobacteria bacterium SURF_5]|uniref:Uroporphyrinogen decarboxylase (URO-D) domain-containing protein n=1 Tax=Abyssobacteria bacterium (strain SURF_5) TaxID=2093360 RepID=A0A3A4NFA9_ABYX5|nr:MAG: hypothetical protein C4520_20175 [Candidatus Abyssubacteria bacterium SURF_5]
MNPSIQQLLELYLQPAPVPPGMTSRDMVLKAIKFVHPPRIPYSFISPVESDFFEVAAIPQFMHLVEPDGKAANIWVSAGKKGAKDPGDRYHDEWGVGWEVTGRHWDHAFDHPLRDLRNLDSYRFPDVADPEKYDMLKPFLEMGRKAGKYTVGFDPILMFERMRALLGFEELMVSPYTQPRGLELLLDRLADLESAVIEQWARIGGVDAYMTWDDWGLQTSLQMDPDTFRKFYKPRYKRIVEAAHQHGMHYIWHNCGHIIDMIPDMIDIGVDVVQLDQPRLMGHRNLADKFGGGICFWNTVDIQWSTMENPTEEEIGAEVAEMIAAFDRFGGGFMARQYPDPTDIEMSPERHEMIYQAFLAHGCSLSE